MPGLRDRLRQARALAREARHLRALPRPVARFYLRAWWTAIRTRDAYTLAIATRPSDAVTLLGLAHGHTEAVELGTGTGWTTIALALADGRRRVVSYDPDVRTERERYLALVDPGTRARLDLKPEPAQWARPAPASVGFLFIDCEHDRGTTADAFRTWEPAVVPGGTVGFHDYDHPLFPGVREAVDELGLAGDATGGVFVWHKPH
jgi:predicted O-methyltransferase YrrM